MKKLTKANIDDLQKQMPLLDEKMQRIVLGGGETVPPRTDCFFLCMNYLREAFCGEKVNYEGAYYLQKHEESGNYDDWGEGMAAEDSDNFMCGYFNMDVMDTFSFGLSFEEDRDYYNDCVNRGEMGRDEVPNFFADRGVMAIVEVAGGNEHAVIITKYNPGGGSLAPMYTFFDPQTGTSGLKTGKDILRIYDVQGLK